MGTTVVALLVSGSRAALAHVGDSRAYRLRGGRLSLLTEDHSFFMECVRAGIADPTRPEAFAKKNIITRSVGPRPAVEVDARVVDVAPGDVFLLCSDGLSGVLFHPVIEALLRAHREPEDAAAALVQEANARGGPDNVTAVVVRCL
jgi:protein phosphatase